MKRGFIVFTIITLHHPNIVYGNFNYSDFSSIEELNLIADCSVVNDKLLITTAMQNMDGSKKIQIVLKKGK